MSTSVAALVMSLCIALPAGATDPVNWPSVANPVPGNPKIEARIQELLGRMSVTQKVAQMVQADIRYVTPDDVRKYRLGSILNGGGAFPADDKHAAIGDWVRLADRFYDASMDTADGAPPIPIIWGTDAVHGHNNVIGATIFPHNIGLGAAHDPDLVERIGAATAREVAVTGIDWTFAPTVAVVRDLRWGRSYESYSERPDIVRQYAGRMVQGLQGTAGTAAFLDTHHILATAKHFLGDGGTDQGIDRGNNLASEQQLLDTHAQGYIAALGAGVQTVMVSYNSWRGVKMHGQRHLITEVLKGRMGFDGLVVSDWDGIDEIQGCGNDHCAQAVNAGIDLFMVPEHWRTFLANTTAQVRAGDIPMSRIDDAVARILRVKLRAGLFERGRPSSWPLAEKAEQLGSAEDRAVAREAVRKSLVLLKNEHSLLPLSPKANVLVTGDGANDIGKQCGGWTITWQGTQNTNADFPGATSIYEGIRSAVTAAGGSATLSTDGQYQSRPDVAIVVFGESPYAEWHGDIRSLEFRGSADDGFDIDIARPAPESSVVSAWTVHGFPVDAQGKPVTRRSTDPNVALVQRLQQAGIPVVAVFLTGRPRGVDAEIDASTAFVVAWLPGTEGSGLADVLFRRPDGHVNSGFSGRLSFSWPHGSVSRPAETPRYAYGYGLSY